MRVGMVGTSRFLFAPSAASAALASLALAAACVRPGAPTSVPLPAPLPPVPGPVVDGTVRWSFETGPEGWKQGAVDAQPVCDPVPAERLPSAILPSLGGDYWRTAIDVGQEGKCRLDTGVHGGRQARLVSPRFTIDRPYLSLLVGGGRRPGTKVGLHLEGAGEGVWARGESGPGSLQMERVVWDVRDLQRKVAQVVVEDEGGDGIVVDDIFDSKTAPRARPAPVWGFADTHAHPIAQLGFGRNVFVGGNDGPIADALGKL